MSRPLRDMQRQLQRFQTQTNYTRDATGRLRDSMGRFASANRSVSSSFGGATTSAHNYTASLGALAAGIAGVVGAQKLMNATVGEAAKMEQSQIVIEAMFDDKKLSKQYMEMMDKFAVDSPLLNSQDMFANSKSFISLSDNTKDLEKMWNLAERLLAVDSAQGVDGAVLALRELFSGDTQSLVERFEMPRKALNDIKNLSLDEQLVELDKLFNKMNMTNKLVTEMGNSSLGVINRIKEAMAGKFRAVGFEALEHLKPIILDIEKAVSSGKLDGFFSKMGQSFAFIGRESSKFANYIKTNWPTIQANIATTKEALAPVGTAFQTAYNFAKQAGDYIVNNWKLVQEVLIAAGAAVITFKAGMAGMAIVATITKMMNAYKATVIGATTAQAFLNGVLFANPIGLVIAAVAALIAVGVLLYRNWDVVKAKAFELWNKLGIFKGAVLALLGPIASLIATGVTLYKNWDKIKAKGLEVWESVKKTVSDSMSSATTAVKNFFEPLMGFIDSVTSKWKDFTGAISSFEMPSFSLPGFGGDKSNEGDGHGFSGGISRIPYNGFMARLHKNERVLTAEENKAYSNGKGGGNTFSFSVVMNGSGSTKQDAEQLFEYFVRKVESAGLGGA